MFRRKMAILLLVIMGLMTACGSQEPDVIKILPSATSEVMAEPEPTGTNTPLPEIGGGEELLFPTATPIEYPDPVWDVEDAWPYGLPLPMQPIEATFGGDVKAYVLLGSDSMPHRNEGDLTDAIVVVFVRQDLNEISVVSIPRDLYVYLPGWGMSRINKAWDIGGIDLVDKVFTYNFGIKPEAIAFGRMGAFVSFVDEVLGGVTVDITNPVYEKCGDVRVNAVPGTYDMSGQTALCFVRGRTYSSDFDRMSRQHDMLRALLSGFLDAAGNDPIKMGEDLYGTYLQAGVKTDLEVFELPNLVFSVLNAKDDIYYYRLIPPLVEHLDHPDSGAWLLIPPDNEEMRELIDFAMAGLPWPISEE